MSIVTMSSKYPVRNHQSPPRMDFKDRGSWHTCVPNFSSLVWIEVCQEPLVLKVHTWRTLRVPDWILGELDHSWHHGLSWYAIFEVCAKFQLSSMIRSVSGTPCPWSHTWRKLKVPDWSREGWGLPWHHVSTLHGIIYLCAKFQLSSMIRSVSRTHPSLKSYLEDIDGSWLESWRMGSYLTS